MEDLRKDVNYILRDCSDWQLDKICEWLVKNDEGWDELVIESIKSRKNYLISFIKEDGINQFMFRIIGNYQTICATTLFTNNNNVHRFNVDKEISALMEASKKQGLKAVVTFEIL